MAEAESKRSDVLTILDDYNVPSRYTDLRTIIALAVGCGWARTSTRKGHIFVAYDGEQVNLPGSAHLNFDVFRTLARKIVRHRAPASARPLHLPLVLQPLGALVNEIIAVVKPTYDQIAVLEDIVADHDEQEAAWREQQRLAAAPLPQPIKAEKPEERHLTDQQAASVSTIIRTWSDGYVDYACNMAGCGYVSENPRSVSSHHASHTKSHLRAVPQPEEDDLEPGYEPLPDEIVVEIPIPPSDDLMAQVAALVSLLVEQQSRERIAALEQEKEAYLLRAITAEDELDKVRNELGALSGMLDGMLKRP